MAVAEADLRQREGLGLYADYFAGADGVVEPVVTLGALFGLVDVACGPMSRPL